MKRVLVAVVILTIRFPIPSEFYDIEVTVGVIRVVRELNLLPDIRIVLVYKRTRDGIMPLTRIFPNDDVYLLDKCARGAEVVRNTQVNVVVTLSTVGLDRFVT